MNRELLVIGYYTLDRNYKMLAHKMKASVEDQGLLCVIHERPSRALKGLMSPMNWVLNINQSSSFIHEMRESHPDMDLLYLDADAEMIRFPNLFFDTIRDFDFAAPILTNHVVTNQLVSNTLYFAATDSANELIFAWTKLQWERDQRMIAGQYTGNLYKAWDQKVLEDVYKTIPDLRFLSLPWEYAKIDLLKGTELMPGIKEEDIVIAQHQASRQNKGHM